MRRWAERVPVEGRLRLAWWADFEHLLLAVYLQVLLFARAAALYGNVVHWDMHADNIMLGPQTRSTPDRIARRSGNGILLGARGRRWFVPWDAVGKATAMAFGSANAIARPVVRVIDYDLTTQLGTSNTADLKWRRSTMHGHEDFLKPMGEPARTAWTDGKKWRMLHQISYAILAMVTHSRIMLKSSHLPTPASIHRVFGLAEKLAEEDRAPRELVDGTMRTVNDEKRYADHVITQLLDVGGAFDRFLLHPGARIVRGRSYPFSVLSAPAYLQDTSAYVQSTLGKLHSIPLPTPATTALIHSFSPTMRHAQAVTATQRTEIVRKANPGLATVRAEASTQQRVENVAIEMHAFHTLPRPLPIRRPLPSAFTYFQRNILLINVPD